MTSEQLNAYLDGELGESERREFELQLERDPNLRAELEQLQSLDRMLRNEYKQSPGIAENVISKITIPEKRRIRYSWIALPLMAAAGLVLGVLIQKNTGGLATQPPAVEPDTKFVGCSLPEHQSIGMVTLATAPLSLVENGKAARDCKVGEPIIRGVQLTTAPAVRAAIALNDGSEVRLDRDTRVELTDRRQLTIHNGCVWLRAAAGEPFVILIHNGRVETSESESIFTVRSDRAVVEEYKGSASVALAPEKKIVKEFESIEITNGKIAELGDVRPFYSDPFVTAWMFELRALAGMPDEELVMQVNGYFEALGRTKGINPASEALALEIANHSKLIIARYYESNQSYLNPQAREAAARILGRLAEDLKKGGDEKNPKK